MTDLIVHQVDIPRLLSLARLFCAHFPGGTTFGLVGTLGAGKTRWVQAIADASGIDVAEVTSPTFTLLQSHAGNDRVLHHLDAYRVADEDEFLELGVDELFDDERAWTLVEWANLVRDVMPKQTVWIYFDLEADEECRTIRVATRDPANQARIDQLRQSCRSQGGAV
ncbi:tRNA (adenosine(37)-N6)-threonylcarbamoyltransferase complex ATPase subunit type 1 TsaE [Novipirellula artificiosorum]|uniref:tRNA threonylcarbamoyladenosine biosynthesis protein TsaE n=1 Tax=Novipirellula artificiosorum TaxID=2528016 RepID=A0A5C6DK80_9BACT|nr:tRNA (adenosine(37)-N6)-threonylcarbamoyltransferase complex ATPase subunit type 1 TsaE [Novipirellula artificiosorum]TWU37148.1 tRNA threonylcarbamoyladenosine biosynthesis protein TsaE [Novipirellula artificiosorum]